MKYFLQKTMSVFPNSIPLYAILYWTNEKGIIESGEWVGSELSSISYQNNESNDLLFSQTHTFRQLEKKRLLKIPSYYKFYLHKDDCRMKLNPIQQDSSLSLVDNIESQGYTLRFNNNGEKGKTEVKLFYFNSKKKKVDSIFVDITAFSLKNTGQGWYSDFDKSKISLSSKPSKFYVTEEDCKKDNNLSSSSSTTKE